ncbi:MAG: hypothetical protein DRP47_10105 [Candidatus Zixiibacteriota bacterium]|nr:MAG: hypothetical protein DRP47_10105 [candidate division Zixibacteria bacterium]
MSNRYHDFIEANKQLWSKLSTSDCSNGLLVVEAKRHPVISHANAVLACIIKEAKGLNIGWIDTGDKQVQERLASYDSDSRTVSLTNLTWLDSLFIILKFVFSSIRVLLTRDVRGFHLDGIPFGDILYDSYLARFKVATIRNVNKGVITTLFILIRNYYRFKRTLQDCGASAVLVSHQVGLSSGVLMRTALGLGVPVYLRTAGNNKVALNLFNSLSEIYQYPYRPRSVDMQLLSSLGENRLNKDFQDLMASRVLGLGDEDVGRAYNRRKKVYHSKSEFAKEFNVSEAKPFVFVMLHAFNDHPHSHFGKMLFRDYYDWFVQTLDFAKTKPDINWVFKEHPTTAFYPTHDISLPDHFIKCPNHIVFLGVNSSFNSQSLLYLADVVVTVLGTAGIEFAALGGIPSILTGATSYSGFGFAIEPKTKAEYFGILDNITGINRLTQQQQDTARKCFLYIQRYSYVPFSFSPLLTLEETKESKLDSYYWKRVTESYKENSDVCLAEFEKYVQCIRRENFSRLNRLQVIEH